MTAAAPLDRPQARTLAEAYAYLELSLPEGQEWIDFGRYSSLEKDEAGDGYVLRYDGPYEGRHVLMEVAVPPAGLFRPVLPLSYGEGVSRLLDAGQWLMVEQMYAAQARMGQERAHPDDYRVIERAWDSARAAVDEIMKFLPPGEAEVPSTAVWTEQGRRARALRPEGLHRARLERAREVYLRMSEELPRWWPHPRPDQSDVGSPVPAEPAAPGLAPDDPLPVRTFAELRAYRRLHPCRCGSATFDEESLEIGAAQPHGTVVVHDAICAGCGVPRDVTFLLPNRPGIVPGEPERFSYAEDGPSRLIDAGQWLSIAAGYAGLGDAMVGGTPAVARALIEQGMLQPGSVPPELVRDESALQPDDVEAAADYLVSAAYAVEEVMKFLPPGADSVPATAFWSRDGVAILEERPETFRREALDRLCEQRWRLVAELRRRYPLGS